MREKYKLEKPIIWAFTFTRENFEIYTKNNLERYSDEEYIYWDKLKYKDLPEGIKEHKDLWAMVKFFRLNSNKTPVQIESGWFFQFAELPFSKKLLHEIDKNAAGTFFTSVTDADKRLFITNWMLEEAISSSQIEWASTTTKNAKEMIQKWIKPKTRDEHMILNNYEAINYIKNDLSKRKIEIWDILYLQSVLTKNTLENIDEIGRFRTNEDEIIVEFEWKEVHRPPAEEFLKEQMIKLIKFANDEDKTTAFIHPVIKAILLHFWIGYLHPFCDGNGRTARALFYWYLLKNDYFWFSYIPLSKAIKKSKIEYAKSYIYSEQDDNDVTYFINYNLKKIQQALKDFEKYVEEKFSEKKKNISILGHLEVNDRQMRLLEYFLEKPTSYTNFGIHMKYYGISKSSSINDLKDLVKKWYLKKLKSGRNTNYIPVENLEELTKKQAV